ncbi:MAG TPA: FxsA family protein [Actinomycetota bacterium]|nr:FxsA family protein [Actinomycetota bacterium]
MLPILVALLIAVPIVELWVIVQVADAAGVPETIGLLLLVSIAGAWLLRQQGTAAWARLRAALARGEVPTKEATDGALIVLGGALLLTPGFLTDVVGLVLLLPPTRAAVKRVARRVLARWARRRVGGPRVYPARVTRVERRRRSRPPHDPSLRSGEDDSPGTG